MFNLRLSLQKAFVVFCFIIYVIPVSAQYTTRADGKVIHSKTTYFNRSFKDKESSTVDYIRFYQKYISEVRGQECPMYPSCSNFGLKSFKESSFSKAFILTSDRLLRCGHDRDNYALTLRENGFKNLDYPVYDKAPQNLYYNGNSYFFAYSDTVKDGDPSLLLIKALINDGLFSEALLEVKRIQYQQTNYAPEIFINELICLRALEEYEKGIYAYEIRCPESLKTESETLYQLATLHYKLGNYDKALQIVDDALKNCKDQYAKSKLTSFKAVLNAQKYDWVQARNSFELLQSLPFPAQLRVSKLKLLETSLPLKQKKESTAALLSILPGAGYAYAGHKQTALSAFVINGLLGYATYSSFKNKNYGMGLLTGVFNLSFYLGNIYGSAKSAKRYNESQRQNLANKLIYNIKP